MRSGSDQGWAFVALLAGATGIGFAPIFVRWSEAGPSATAFYRVFLALPVFWLATRWEPRPGSATAGGMLLGWVSALAGVLFAADLAFWHWSIRLTSVANSTLLTNCAPFFVTLGARLLFHERLSASLVFGMIVAAAGAALLVGANVQFNASHVQGDVLALVTAVFYGGYLLTIKYLRVALSTVRILAWSGSVSCAVLLPIALLSHETVRVHSCRGWLVLVGLALISQVGGQGLIGYALAHLPAGFSSVSLLVQPVVAAWLAWLILSEPLGLLQTVGGAVVLCGIALAAAGRNQATVQGKNLRSATGLRAPAP